MSDQRAAEFRPVVVSAGVDGWLIWAEELAGGGRRTLELVDDEGLALVAGHAQGWWIARTRRPSSVHWTTKERTYGSYRLQRPQLNTLDAERWPLEVDDLHNKCGDAVHSGDDYVRTFEERVVEHVVDLADAVSPSTRSAAEAVPDPAWLKRWQVYTVPAVLNRAEFHPWLPGRLVRFRAHMATLLDAMPNVVDVYCARPKSSYQPAEGPTFSVRMLWDPPRTKTKASSRWITVSVPLSDVPEAIDGSDLWDAIDKWNAAEAEWLAEWAMIGARACGACEGRGFIATGVR